MPQTGSLTIGPPDAREHPYAHRVDHTRTAHPPISLRVVAFGLRNDRNADRTDRSAVHPCAAAGVRRNRALHRAPGRGAGRARTRGHRLCEWRIDGGVPDPGHLWPEAVAAAAW